MRNRPTRVPITVSCVLLFALGLAFPGAAQQEGGWREAPVPQAWKDTGGTYAAREGFLWYRCFVSIPERWEGRRLELFAEAVDDARQFFFNGRRIGQFGEFPPAYRSGLGQTRRFPIDPQAVRFGQVNMVAVRICERDGRGNFNVAAPVLFAENEAIRLQGTWQYRPGDDLAWAAPPDAIPADVPAFDRIEPAEVVARTVMRLEGDQGPLAPEQTLQLLQTPEDLQVQLVLSEPVIGQPLSIRFDARGRLWLVEYLQYPYPAGLKMVSRDRHLRTIYDKVPPPPPHHFPGRDRITIHEDTDGDGVYDRHKVFVQGLNLATSVALGRGGVWVLNPPYLLFYPDRNGDDVPDGDPEVHLEGFGLEDSHSLVNNLRWGPDGWLYGAQGSTVTAAVRRPGSTDPPVTSMGQLIWRYHPERRVYEIFAEGGGNTFGLEFDSKGRIFSGHNGGNTRGFHYVQGGYFQKGFNKHGPLSNPYAFGYFSWMPHPNVPRFTHAMAVYQADLLPQRYLDRLFCVAPLQSQVVIARREVWGSSFRTQDEGLALRSGDPWVRPVDIQLGPDGALYIADFYEQRIDHASHYQGRVHRESGRIYRLVPRGSHPALPPDLSTARGEALLDLLRHANRWTRQTALRLIADQKDPSLLSPARERLFRTTGQESLEYLWAVYLLGGLDEATALRALKHDDPYVRLWAVRLVCDWGQVSPGLWRGLVELAGREKHAEVRCQLACSARRLPAPQCMKLVEQLVRHDQDVNDPYIPLLLWWAVERHCEQGRQEVFQTLEDPSFWGRPLVEKFLLQRLMRRFAATGRRNDLLLCARLLDLAPTPGHQQLLLQGFEQAYEGRSLAGLPQQLVEAIARAGGGSLRLRVRQRNQQAVQEALRRIEDRTVPAAERVDLVRLLAQTAPEPARPALVRLATSGDAPPVQAAALSALQVFSDDHLASEILARLDGMPEGPREAALTLLASRPGWARELLEAVDQGQVPAQEVPPSVLRQILLHPDQNLRQRVRHRWGTVEGETTEQMQQEIARLRSVVLSGSGDPYQGRPLFEQICGKCHTLFEDGGHVGPDLTPYQRDNLDTLLLNIVNPSQTIREGYETYAVITQDGRALTGFIEDQDEHIVALKQADGQLIILPRAEIEEMKAMPVSLMPEGLLKGLDDQQIRDLMAYLRMTQPLP